MTGTVIRYGRNGNIGELTLSNDTKEINLRGPLSSDEGIDWVETENTGSLDNLRVLRLDSNLLKEIALNFLRNSPQLEVLNLGSNLIESVDLEVLGNCTKLRKVVIGSNNLKYLDVSPLANCSHLKLLALHYNQIKSMDLGPLANCTKLEILLLNNNQLSAIDLNPLGNCKNLERLDLSENDLHEVNLSLLRNCSQLRYVRLDRNNLEHIGLKGLQNLQLLRELYLHSNNIEHINLEPLENCSSLFELSLYDNNLETVDMTPLSLCENLKILETNGNRYERIGITFLKKQTLEELQTRTKYHIREYDVPVEIRNLDVLRSLAHIIRRYETDSWKCKHLTRCLVRTIGLKKLGLLDITDSQLVSIIEEPNKSIMQDRLVKTLCDQLDEQGTTIGVDIDNIAASSYEPLSNRVSDILELRLKEIEQVVIRVEDTANLKPLWLTAYGYKILMAMKIGLMCTDKEFEQVESSFEETGLVVHTTGKGSAVYPSTKISDSMKQYIWTLVKKRAHKNELNSYPTHHS
ncbi:MAG: leucine-rich repeat protein [Candidatus Lokiarchaeota archaeon]|nr:leucine-rich repeat protein [Candidatus Lokiarchaeota archaeon]